ncbi:MAG: PQQ-dependent sugar dehydrogenase, partial [Balneolaceae bacterium]|nr:PQQ-dependent sugar dehydrogenase [Balneolaceae bacterium]
MKKGLIISIITAFFCIVFSESLYSQDYAITPITSERFPNPLGLEVSHSDSDHLYIVRQAGFIHRLSRSNPSDPSDVWIDVSDRIITGGERGLLGLAFHPDYPNNDTFFILYTFEEDDLLYSTVARFNAPGGTPDPDSEERLLIIEQSAANHNGGQLKFGPDGYLYIASGDGGGLENRFNSQDTGNLLGKILRIDVDTGSGYGIPSGNPFVGDSDGRDEIFAWGFRNPWRMSFDEATGNLWTADVGEKDWESIYVVEAGKNYGWPIVEGSNCFEDDDCDKDGLEMPLFEYPWGEDDTGRSITGGYVYRGSDNPSLFGKYIYGDFISGNMWALEVDHDNLEVISNSEIFQADFLIPSFGTDSDGEIYILRWGSEGQIYRFEPDDEPLSPPGVVSLIAPEDEAVDVPIDPTLSWEEVSEGESYRVQVSGDPEFDGLVVDESDLTETEFGVEGLDYETTYFWRVRASNEAGDGEWSEAWSFATEDEPLSPPGVVSLFAPEDEAVDVSIDPTLSWEEVSEVESYRVQVAGDPEFDDLVVDESDLTETEFEVEGLDYETTYFWRVRASNEAGDGEWSEAWSFATE